MLPVPGACFAAAGGCACRVSGSCCATSAALPAVGRRAGLSFSQARGKACMIQPHNLNCRQGVGAACVATSQLRYCRNPKWHSEKKARASMRRGQRVAVRVTWLPAGASFSSSPFPGWPPVLIGLWVGLRAGWGREAATLAEGRRAMGKQRHLGDVRPPPYSRRAEAAAE